MAFPTGWTTYWQATPINPNGNLGAFVAYIDLSILSGLGEIARSDGLDICVTDESNNRLPCDLMPWYNNGSGQLYININKTTENQPIRVWAGNPSFDGEPFDGTYGQYATYHANVLGHYPSGDGNDRTIYQNNMSTAVGSVVPGGGVTGYAGGRSTLYSGGQGFYGGSIFSSGQSSIISYINMTGVAPAGGISTIASLNCSSSSVRQMLSSNIGTLSTFVSLTSSDGAVATANTSAIPIPNEWCHTSSSRDQDAIVSGTQRGTSTERAIALNPARYSIGLTRTTTTSSRFFSGYIGRTTFYTGNLGTGYRNYDYLMTDQSSFWGNWSRINAENFPSGYAGYDTVTLPNPATGLINFTYVLDLSQLSASWWSNVKSDGGDIQVYSHFGARLPAYLHNWGYSANSGQLYFSYTGGKPASGSDSVRIYAGNANESQPAADDAYGQYNAFPSHLRAFYPDGGGNDVTRYVNHLGMSGSPTVGGSTGWFNGEKSTTYNESSQYGLSSISVPTGVPLTLLASVYRNNTASNKYAMMVCSSSSSNEFGIRANSSTNEGVSRAAGTARFFTNSTVSANTWTRIGAQFISATSRYQLRNGSPGTQSTSSSTPTSINLISVGASYNLSGGSFWGGRLANLQLHTVAVSNAWAAYDYSMLSSQSSFYTQSGWTALSGESGGSGGTYQEITGYSDISTYSYTESNSLRNIFGESYVYTYQYGDLDVTNNGAGPIDIYGYSDTITYSYVGSCVYGNVPGMVGYWPLQDTAAGTVVSGIGCPNGIATGANPPSSVTVNILSMTGLGPGGLIPRSLFFNGHPGFGNGGTGQYIVLPITGSNGSGYLRNVDAFSYSIWAKYIQDDANNLIIVATPSGGSTKRASLELGSHPAPYSSNQRFESQISTTDATDIEFDSPVSPLSSGIWYNLVVTANFNTKTVNHYLNGELVLTETGNFGSAFVNRNLSGFRLATAGVPGDINDNKFNGYLADFRLYHRELSETEARKLYRFGVDECIVGITQSLNINSPVYTTSNNRASLIKSVTSESITNTRAEARAYLDMILSSISNTTTLSDGTLDETDSVISIASIVNIVTDSYGISSVIRLAASESNTNTSSLSTAQIQTLLSAIANIYTLANGELDNEDVILIEGICRVLTSASATCSIIMPLTVESNTKIDSSALGQVIAELRTSIEVKTGLFGAVLKDIGLVSTSNTNTSFNGSVSLELSAASVVRVLTAMDGTATIEVEVDGNIIYLTVYVTMNDAQNPLYINQARVIELSNSRNISF